MAKTGKQKQRTAAAATTPPAKKAEASTNIPGVIQYTDASGNKHTAYVARRRPGNVFDLTYHVGPVKCAVSDVVQGDKPGTWQLLPEAG